MAERPGRDRSDALLDFMRLIWAVDHELESVSKRMEAQLGLTVPQRLTLLLIGRQPGILASELASLLHVHPGTVSGVIGRLEAAGLVRRASDAEDARRQRLVLTAKGLRANRRRRGTFQDAVARTLRDSTPAEIAGAAQLLKRLAAVLHDIARSPRRSKR